ncbi:MAG TPA: DUF6454 family protein [bacterium]|nr:DUF6454 family protein [bacterium]
MKRLLRTLLFLPCILFGAAPRLEAVPYVWRLIEKVQPKFEMFHTQGLLKIGNRFYLSAVEVKDKDKGIGVGHFYEFDAQGTLLKETVLGEGAMYHPGGIDFDGQWIWVPVAEYKSRSHAILYKINPKTLQAIEAFRVNDHIGAVVYNRELKTVIGMNWDSQAFYEWTPEGKQIRKVINDMSDYSYQDCKYLQGPAMLCSGTRANANGGLAVVDLLDFELIQDIQMIPRTPKKTLMTRNPMAIDVVDQKIRYYFLPEDHNGPMYVFEIY